MSDFHRLDLVDRAIKSIAQGCNLELRTTHSYQGLFGSGLVTCYGANSGGPIERLVRVDIESRMLGGIVSSIIYAPTSKTSAAPYFALDVARAGDVFTVFCDIIPKLPTSKCCLGTPYFDKIYAPLIPLKVDFLRMSNIKEVPLTDVQKRCLSPYPLAFTTSSLERFVSGGSIAIEYIDHWLEVLSDCEELTADSNVSPRELEQLDIDKRKGLFSPDVDKVWQLVQFLLGIRQAEAIRHLLMGEF